MAWEAVEAAECVVELAVDTTDFAAELTVDPVAWVADEAVLVTLGTETVGVGTEMVGAGTETFGGLETAGVLTDGVETEGSPEPPFADAPDPPMAARATVRMPARINHFARFIDGS